MNIKNDIIEFANSIGIDYIGFCDINFSEEFVGRLRERKKKGYLSGFEESDENKRTDINSLLDDVNTIISIALPYRTIDVDKNKPYFSKSSLGQDYHLVMKKKLKLIEEFLINSYNARCISFSDIGPLSDREIAYKSGIGFYGKNSNIITKRYGSFVFLGEILTDIFIERDKPIERKCGECSLCINACPTGAIDSSGINAKKCLSYITQKKEDLSFEEMDKMGTRIYGCDACQDVCPFNRCADKSSIQEFIPVDWNIDIDVEKFINMTNRDFKETFGMTSSGWRGNKILKRNLIIAIGNSKNKNYIGLLHNIRDEKLKRYAERSIAKLMNNNDE